MENKIERVKLAKEYLTFLVLLIVGVPFGVFGPHYDSLQRFGFTLDNWSRINSHDFGWFALLVPYCLLWFVRTLVWAAMEVFPENRIVRKRETIIVLYFLLLLFILVGLREFYRTSDQATVLNRIDRQSTEVTPWRGSGLPRLPRR